MQLNSDASLGAGNGCNPKVRQLGATRPGVVIFDGCIGVRITGIAVPAWQAKQFVMRSVSTLGRFGSSAGMQPGGGGTLSFIFLRASRKKSKRQFLKPAQTTQSVVSVQFQSEKKVR